MIPVSICLTSLLIELMLEFAAAFFFGAGLLDDAFKSSLFVSPTHLAGQHQSNHVCWFSTPIDVSWLYNKLTYRKKRCQPPTSNIPRHLPSSRACRRLLCYMPYWVVLPVVLFPDTTHHTIIATHLPQHASNNVVDVSMTPLAILYEATNNFKIGWIVPAKTEHTRKNNTSKDVFSRELLQIISGSVVPWQYSTQTVGMTDFGSLVIRSQYCMTVK